MKLILNAVPNKIVNILLKCLVSLSTTVCKGSQNDLSISHGRCYCYCCFVICKVVAVVVVHLVVSSYSLLDILGPIACTQWCGGGVCGDADHGDDADGGGGDAAAGGGDTRCHEFFTPIE